MNYQIRAQPSYSFVEVELEPGEKLVAESGSMAWMAPNILTETSTRGGLMSGLKRKFLSGESFFQNTYQAEGGPGRIALAPGSAGDITTVMLENEELFLEKGAYLASEPGVTCDAKWDGLKGFFNEGLFILRCSGSGRLFFNAYGAIELVEVDGEYTVDNGFAVAWEPTLQYRITRAKRIRSFLFADQLLLKFSGRGKVWIQSRSPQALASWVHPFRRVQRKDSGGE
ncbi:MAG: hypothetical protein ACI841_000560 [Planctomycetota bacterium]|jgi:uncharacterized protein (TIGR00266 family)